ncbi:YqeG family HAD IIIA-type phosphatase [Bacillus horti]|uniref:HAD superfamily phosphatase (TIGR01668 family) n=1 Tax=Caldalkalibacillus horti TaxID=77523 RepID=A0ABT9VTC6_9BACI|nr:YqeG family HAD IIIA-type phosphatase [Bacillus horti]MDQ0164135.1 HAD superfamily phosphatase (TIGR01668 family) [Bacillus horti]
MLKQLLPDMHAHSIYEIDLDELKERGVKGIITDLDNTLIEWDRPGATPELIKWFEKVEEKGFKLVIVSNNNKKRVSLFADPLNIPFVFSARKPFNKAFKRAQQMMELKPTEVVVIGDQLFTDVLGGNRLKLYTILVVPVASSDGIFTRFNRRMERMALSFMRKRGMITWED